MDKIVYVTGGANGIGKAIVTLFCKDGADVTFCDIDTVAGEKLSNELSSYKCTYHEVDLSDARVLEQSVNKVIEAKGNIDVIINNAGVSHFNSMLDITVEDFDKVMDIRKGRR